MDQFKIICECNHSFTQEEFSKHFEECEDLNKCFNEFDSKFSSLLKQYSKPKERLLILYFLLKQYTKKIEGKLLKLFAQPLKEKENMHFNSINLKESIEFCQRCKVNPDIIYLQCSDTSLHPICNNCFIKYAEDKFYDMKCNICQKSIDEQTKRNVLGDEKYKELENKFINILFPGL